MTLEQSVYFWYFDGSVAQAARVAATGAGLAWLKAGGDRGIVWIPGAPTGGFARPQWDDAYLEPLTSRGVEGRPWFYNWPAEADKGAVERALAHRWSDAIVLNPETEWRVQSPESPYTNLAKANEYAAAWVNDLRARLVRLFGRAPAIGFSSVPSWADFPYEGFAAACAFAHPQHYWHDAMMARGENQVEAHYRRTPLEACVPILTACREYDDAGVLALARSALLHPIAGLSAWEAGNSAFQAEAMRQAYALLPADKVPIEEGEVREPGAGEVNQYLNERGELIAVVNMGGEAKEILGVDYANIGGRVKNAAGAIYHRSLLDGEMQGWVKEPAIDQGG